MWKASWISLGVLDCLLLISVTKESLELTLMSPADDLTDFDASATGVEGDDSNAGGGSDVS